MQNNLIGWDVLFSSHHQHTLNHWGRATHICVGTLTIIASDNGLSPGRRQAIIWTNAGILLIGSSGTNFSEILIEIYTFSFKKMRLKGSSGKWWPFCLGLNVLKWHWNQKRSVLPPWHFSSPVLMSHWEHLLPFDDAIHPGLCGDTMPTSRTQIINHGFPPDIISNNIWVGWDNIEAISSYIFQSKDWHFSAKASFINFPIRDISDFVISLHVYLFYICVISVLYVWEIGKDICIHWCYGGFPIAMVFHLRSQGFRSVLWWKIWSLPSNF